jgi:hypothetical protein
MNKNEAINWCLSNLSNWPKSINNTYSPEGWNWELPLSGSIILSETNGGDMITIDEVIRSLSTFQEEERAKRDAELMKTEMIVLFEKLLDEAEVLRSFLGQISEVSTVDEVKQIINDKLETVELFRPLFILKN